MIWRVEVEEVGRKPFIVLIDAELDTPVSNLISQFEHAGITTKPLTVQGRDLAQIQTFGETGLKDGQTIFAGPQSGVQTHVAQSGLYLVTVSGPDAGRVHQLTQGRFSMGRDGANDYPVDDPYMSRRHATLVVDSSWGVTFEDHSSNGSIIENETILNDSRPVEVGSFLHIGSSLILLKAFSEAERSNPVDQLGPHRTLHCRFRTAEPSPPLIRDEPKEPAEPGSSNSSVLQSLMPLVAGIGFAVIRRNYLYLLIGALSPIMYGALTFFRNRKKVQKQELAVETYKVDLENWNDQLTLALTNETQQARVRSNGLGMGWLSALHTNHCLWERRSVDPDFGSLAIGYGDKPTALRVKSKPDLHSWAVPIEHSFTETGSLSVLGDLANTTKTLRGLCLSLACNYSPNDLQIWIFSDPSRADDWDFAQWLPHTQSEGLRSSIAFSERDRAVLFQSLKQQLEVRLETQEKGVVPGPLHIAIFDSADLVVEAELSELSQNGPNVGVSSIVADPTITPQGTNAKLTVDTEPDKSIFESVHQPRLEGVKIALANQLIATETARSLAALRPALTGGSSIPSSINLVEQLDLERLDVESLAERWRTQSPATKAVVGVSSDLDVAIDIADHGPHGLVGGMSGSGKTEFLMTYLTSLCLNNDPDDLAIVIVDFKGGVDHDLTKELPHVIDLTTNLAIQQFQRTLDLLSAEQERRQRMLAGTGDIVAYQKARQSDPSLPPLPRLIVVVDEFSQLLASEDGRVYLKDLAEITRIGRALGIHLLLVTQTFEGKLSGDIESNSGLRVCLRVTKPSHSKIVLGSGVAASISKSTIGRAYARLNSVELTEFQTARVAAPRRGGDQQASSCTIVPVTVDILAQLDVGRREDKCPANETDMFHLVELMKQASNGSREVIPWPKTLLEKPDENWLAAQAQVSSDPVVGIQDVPRQQTQGLLQFTAEDQQMLLVGGRGARLEQVVSALILSLAFQTSPDDTHIHAIDPRGVGLGSFAELGHCGTVATRSEGLSLRLVEHLYGIATLRRSEMLRFQVRNIDELEAASGFTHRRIWLFVADADVLASRQEEQWTGVRNALIQLISESVDTGVRIVLAGDQRLADTRLGSSIERRFVFALPPDVSPVGYGVPRSLSVELDTQNRCVDVNRGLLTQMVRLEEPSRLNLVAQPTQHIPTALVSVTWPFPMDQVKIDSNPEGYLSPLPVGINNTTGLPLWWDLAEDGPVVAVAGEAQSGKSTGLIAIAALAKRQGFEVIASTPNRRSPLANLDRHASWISNSIPVEELSKLSGSISTSTVLIIDDAHRLHEDIDLGALSQVENLFTVLSGPVDVFDGRRFSRLSIEAAIILKPSGSRAGNAFGVRTVAPELLGNHRAGQGICISQGQSLPIQVPLPTSE